MCTCIELGNLLLNMLTKQAKAPWTNSFQNTKFMSMLNLYIRVPRKRPQTLLTGITHVNAHFSFDGKIPQYSDNRHADGRPFACLTSVSLQANEKLRKQQTPRPRFKRSDEQYSASTAFSRKTGVQAAWVMPALSQPGNRHGYVCQSQPRTYRHNLVREGVQPKPLSQPSPSNDCQPPLPASELITERRDGGGIAS